MVNAICIENLESNTRGLDRVFERVNLFSLVVGLFAVNRDPLTLHVRFDRVVANRFWLRSAPEHATGVPIRHGQGKKAVHPRVEYQRNDSDRDRFIP